MDTIVARRVTRSGGDGGSSSLLGRLAVRFVGEGGNSAVGCSIPRDRGGGGGDGDGDGEDDGRPRSRPCVLSSPMCPFFCDSCGVFAFEGASPILSRCSTPELPSFLLLCLNKLFLLLIELDGLGSSPPWPARFPLSGKGSANFLAIGWQFCQIGSKIPVANAAITTQYPY